MKIKDIFAYEVLDSRANPTVRVQVTLDDGSKAAATVPSGASTGSREALELRDGNTDDGGSCGCGCSTTKEQTDVSGFFAKRVRMACKNVNEVLKPLLLGKSAEAQEEIDSLMQKADGTHNYSKLGANAVLGVSMAIARAAALAQKKELYEYISVLSGHKDFFIPRPMLNVINGGAHAQNAIDFQEFMIIPLREEGFPTFKDSLFASCAIYHILKRNLSRAGKSTGLGDEGGFAPELDNEEAIKFLEAAIEEGGFTPRFAMGLDVAASEFYKDGSYQVAGKKLNSSELISMYEGLVAKHKIISIEDGMAENDFAGWLDLTQKLGQRMQLVGDDLFVTNTEILKEGIEKGWANSILIKPNQIGTVSQTIAAIKMAHKAGYTSVMSHRSGESEDSFIADFAVGAGCSQIKTGAPARSERAAKYNRLIEIEQLLA